MKKHGHFVRGLSVIYIYQEMLDEYDINSADLVFPPSVFKNPMNLIPISEVNRWLKSLNSVTGNPDAMFEAAKRVNLDKIGSIGYWFFSGHDLSSTIRRINTGIHCLQSGVFLAGAQVGPILKWTYHNPSIESEAKVHDSVRVAVFMTKVLRRYLGEDFSPARVMLSGKRDNDSLYRQYFGCEIEWNHSKTEVWFNSNLRLATRQVLSGDKKRLAMSFSDLDEYLNMPDAEDELKVIYETINYSRHFGLPTLERVSGLLGLSEQQFQRRLHRLGLNFSTIMGYVLSNIAVELLRHNIAIEEIAERLGYLHVASFNRMFKKHRGLTPKQYLDRFSDAF